MEKKITDIFGTLVFDEEVMEERLAKDTFRELQKTIKAAYACWSCFFNCGYRNYPYNIVKKLLKMQEDILSSCIYLFNAL